MNDQLSDPTRSRPISISAAFALAAALAFSTFGCASVIEEEVEKAREQIEEASAGQADNSPEAQRRRAEEAHRELEKIRRGGDY